MPKLLKAIENEGHEHIIFLKDNGEGITSKSLKDDHSHEVFLDEFGNLQIVESNGHSHDFEEIEFQEIKDPKIKGSDDELLVEAQELVKESSEIEFQYRDDGYESYEFEKGNQWDPRDSRKLKEEKRSQITVNEIKSIVNAVVGQQRQNRTDIKYIPIENHNPMGASIANVVVKWGLDKANFTYHESKGFKDGIVTGRGNWEVSVELDKQRRPMIKIQRFKWDMVFYGPHEYEDMSDLEYMTKTKWFSIGKLKSLFPEKEDELQSTFEFITHHIPTVDKRGNQIGNIHHNRYGRNGHHEERVLLGTEPMVDIQRKNIRLFEVWRKKYKNIKILSLETDDGNEFEINTEYLSPNDLKMAKKIEGAKIKDDNDYHVEILTFAGHTFLGKKVYILDEFNTVPYYVSKDDDYIQGIVKPLIDLQKQSNKRQSQAMDILAKSNNYGWIYDDQTFLDQKEENKFKRQANSPGWTAKVQNINNAPIKVESGSFPAEHVQMINEISAKMRQISGVNEESLGLQSNAKSGVAIMRRIRQGMVANDYLFDNLSMSKKILGRVIIKIVQKIFTPQDIMRILKDVNANDPITLSTIDQQGQLQQAPLETIAEEEIIKFLENEDFSKYDVSITETANTPTRNMDRFIALTEMMSQGILNPIAIELAKQAGILSPLDAEKLNRMLESQAQAQAQQDQAKNATELLKSGVNPALAQQAIQ